MDATHQKDAQTLLAALREDLAGRQKAVALTVYDDATPATAESHMSRLASGASGDAVWRTLALVLREGAPHLLTAIADLANATWTPRTRDAAELRTEALAELAHVREQLDHIADELRDADTAELREGRKGPHKVAPRRRRESA